MASNIKGIIVEIGGDTSGLQKALKKVNSATSSLSKELRGINSLLKLDPKNTELLTQKQTVLKEKIEATTEQLKQLKNAQDMYIKSGGDLNSDKYRSLQRQIISTENELKGLNQEASRWTKLSNNLGNVSSKMQEFGNKIQEVGKKASIASGLVAGLFGAGIKYNADIETTTKAFETFLGSAEDATNAINEIRKQSKTSPFDTKELIKANQYLITTGESADSSRKTISALADAISLTGGGNDELNRMASNLQQIKNAGKATSMDIRQFAYAGIDVYGILADTTGKNVEELKKMDITYEELSKALIQASSEGGKYYNGQSKMADTLNGKINKLKKTFQDLLGELSESLMPIIEKIIGKLQEFLAWFSQLDQKQKDMITKIGLAIVALGPALTIIGKLVSVGGKIAGVLGKISAALGKASAGIGGIGKVLTVLSGPIGIVIAAVGALIGIFVHLYKTNEEFRNKVQETWKNIVDVFQTYVMPVIMQIKEFISNVLQTIWSVIQTVWSTIEPFVQEIFETILDWWNDTGSDIFASLMLVLSKIMEGINWLWKNVLDPIIKFLLEVLKPVIGAVFGAISGVINSVLDVIKSVWNGIKGVFEGIINFITGVFSGDWKKAWEGVKQIFANIASTLGNIFKAPINFIIDVVNGFIKGINKIKMPDWVPGIGGKGINVPLIPKLAKGGIVDSATLAMIGEGKSAEAVIPLDRTLTNYIAEAMRIAGGNKPLIVNFYPQKMTDAEMDRAFEYIDKKFGMAY